MRRPQPPHAFGSFFGFGYAELGIGKQKFRKNRRPRKEPPVWILLLRANMFTYRKNKNYWRPIGCRVDK
uniref:Uncharacterized protein n=1 Tax=Candidatus Kentrum sp. LPFa TaxID=2126335 RepID=A0A450W4Q9_9GAMM|nr:MAG: hypothetical protein BECKLPF1236A_GA0070988_100634 [Candidatus Kentron sp. LPFa]VFK28005.1 MAG: hypothetical protein BECKLPF1236C_GA0070990_100564 [Candidatus Kentron sp. LPFa]